MKLWRIALRNVAWRHHVLPAPRREPREAAHEAVAHRPA